MNAVPMRWIALALCSLGLALHLYTVIFRTSSGAGWPAVVLLLVSLLPYGVAAILASRPRWVVPATGAALACLATDLFVHYAVFVNPASSTAAIGLVVTPVWNLLVVGPAGAVVAWLAYSLWRRNFAQTAHVQRKAQ